MTDNGVTATLARLRRTNEPRQLSPPGFVVNWDSGTALTPYRGALGLSLRGVRFPTSVVRIFEPGDGSKNSDKHDGHENSEE